MIEIDDNNDYNIICGMGLLNDGLVSNLHQMDIKHPGGVSMGTTIVAMKYNEGVILAADSRTSSGSVVVNRAARKITRILPNIFLLRSGSAADTQNLSTIIRYHAQALRQQLRRNGRNSTVTNSSMELDNNEEGYSYRYDDTVQGPSIKSLATATHNLVHEYRDMLSCGLILGGYDSINGPEIYNIAFGGTLIPVDDFVASGSGSGFILGFLQDNYRKELNKEECLGLLKKAIKYAVYNDNSSGGIMRAVSVTRTTVHEYYFDLESDL